MAAATFRGPILVTGATGQQGGSLIRALLTYPSPPRILAVTRDPNSASAKRLAQKSPTITLIQGDLNNVPQIFASALQHVPQIHGVFSVQLPAGIGGIGEDTETTQGTSLIDEAVRHKVRHFVYASVERGGDVTSWTNPTNVPHFRTKHDVELHLRAQSAKAASAGQGMAWTILRPVAFFDNLAPNMQSKVFIAALKSTLGNKPLQWIAIKDIGIFGARAFAEPERYNERAIGLAGDDLTVEQLITIFNEETKTGLTPTFGILGGLLKLAVKEMRLMIDWFGENGFGVDVAALRREEPRLLDLRAWIREESKFEKK